MHARGSVKHQRVARESQLARTLDERDPALINLPVPVPSIPLLSPILTSLVAGAQPAVHSSSKAATTPATPTTTTPAASTPTPTSAGESPGSSSSPVAGSGSGSSSSGSSGSTGENSGGSSSGSSGSAGGSDGSDGNTTGGNSGSNSSTGGGISAGASSTTNNPSEDGLGNVGGTLTSSILPAALSKVSLVSGVSVSGAASGTKSIDAGSTGLAISAGSNDTSSSGSLEGTSPVIDIGANTPENFATTGGIMVSGAVTLSALGSASTDGTSADGISGNGGSGPQPGGSTASSGNEGSHHLSAGAIAAIAVVSGLAAIALVVFVLRRRFKARRFNRLNNWQAVSSSSFNFDGSDRFNPGTRSARSSFATSYDISTPSAFDFSTAPEMPAMPMMAEIHDTHGPGFVTHAPGQRINTTPNIPAIVTVSAAGRRSSVRSVGSDTSLIDPYSQFLVIRQPEAANDLLSPEAKTPTTPMSVRPFSPSEMFSFPKPPKASGEWDQYSLSLQSPRDDQRIAINPFVDPEPRFGETEVIRRPFAPTMDDEMLVNVGDRVKIMEIFSDGWALVEKIAVTSDKGKAKETCSKLGLIPVDCMREAGQQLPAFLTAKRVSSYGVAGIAI